MAEETKPTLKDLVKNAIQIGIVVDDLDKVVENMRFIFGAEPDFVKDMPYPWVNFKGEPTDAQARVASYRTFGIELEFMIPLGTGDSTWAEHRREAPHAGYSLHHIRFNDPDDNDVITELLKEKGIDVYMEGGSVTNPSGKFTYYDTREQLGFIIEFVSKPPKANA